jgi:addiction module HigA family antidote
MPRMSKSSTIIKRIKEISMRKAHITPVHPGEVLKDELEEIELTQTALANHIGVLPKTINEICRGKRGISADMAMKLSKALGGSPQFWLNLQNNWELSQLDATVFDDIQPIAAQVH